METFLSLEQMLRHSWNMIFQGTAKRNSPMREVVLGTINLQGVPQNRVIILRKVEVADRSLTFFTDYRSEKINDIQLSPQVSVLFWDSRKRVQIRCTGQMSVYINDSMSKMYWDRIPKQGRNLYATTASPGTPMPENGAYMPSDWDSLSITETDSVAFPNFCVLVCQLSQLDVLHLGREKHQRGQFNWNGIRWEMQWVIP